jgi:ubiquinone biosynthesis protein
MNKALWELSNTYRRYVTLRRFLQTIFIIIEFLFRHHWKKIVGKRLRRQEANPSSGGQWERVRLLIEELGPTFIKFGQILSTRAECPPQLRDELKKLQDQVPPFSYKEVEDTIEEELAAPIEELFVSFGKEPIAAASLGQVHEAVLRQGRNRRKKVAVKVQRPNIENIIEVDLSVLEFLLRTINKFLPRTRVFNLPVIIDAFGTSLRREIDYILEGRNCDKLAKIHKNDNTVYIPKIFWNYTTKRVLAMEFIDGIKISEVNELDKAGLDRHKVALHMTRAYMKQIFKEGFLHADPHPGNLFVLEDEVIAFVDFGMVEYIDDKLLADLTELLVAIVHDNTGPRVAEEFMNIHTGNKWEVDYPKLVLEMSTFIDRHFVDGKIPLAQKGVGYIMNELVYGVYQFGVKLPPPLVLVIKTLLYVEMLANELYSGFDVLDMVEPHVNRRLRKKYREKADVFNFTNPKDMLSDLADAADEAVDFIKNFPRQMNTIMDKAERGELEFNVKNSSHSSHLMWGIIVGVVIVVLLIIIIVK